MCPIGQTLGIPSDRANRDKRSTELDIIASPWPKEAKLDRRRGPILQSGRTLPETK